MIDKTKYLVRKRSKYTCKIPSAETFNKSPRRAATDVPWDETLMSVPDVPWGETLRRVPTDVAWDESLVMPSWSVVTVVAWDESLEMPSWKVTTDVAFDEFLEMPSWRVATDVSWDKIFTDVSLFMSFLGLNPTTFVDETDLFLFLAMIFSLLSET